jgi:sodium/pantothenate symporter
MFWKKGNHYGALAAICWGMIIYALTNTVIPEAILLGAHPSMISVLSAVFVYIIVSLMTEKPSEEIVVRFWGKPKKAQF